MRILQLRSRPKRRPVKRVAAKRGAKTLKKGVSAKASNWFHAKARSVRNGHRPRTVLIGIFSGVMSTVLLGLWLSGHLGDAYGASKQFGENRLLAAGFSVEHIDIDGATHASEAEVRNVLGVEKGELVFGVNLVDARKRIESLGWVEQASISRLLPNRISVVIIERTPFAVWQNKNQFNIVNVNGVIIEPASILSYPDLPLIVGAGAGEEAAGILAVLATKKGFQGRVRSLVRVSGRRWNIRFTSGAELRLPASGWKRVLEKIATSPELYQMLEIPATLIDARVSGRYFVRVNDHRKPVSGKLTS